MGRFQPLHNGHLKVMLKIIKEVEYLVVGIVNPDPKDTINFKDFASEKNPFNFWERYRMIHESLKESGVDMSKVYIVPSYPPSLYNDEKFERFLPKKDETIIYLPVKKAEKWKIEDLIKRGWNGRSFKVKNPISATEVRRRIAEDENWEELVPRAVAKIIKEVDGINRIKNLKNL
jgi:nicotinamide-nucleotide adenylyltransferase